MQAANGVIHVVAEHLIDQSDLLRRVGGSDEAGVFPDQEAPVVRSHDSQRELIKMRWGMPPPPKFGWQRVTNIRNIVCDFGGKRG